MLPPNMTALFRYVRERIATYGDAAEVRAVAYLLLEEGFGVTPMDIYTDKVKQFSAEEAQQLDTYLQRLAKGEPLQYVLGRALFLDRWFAVSHSVLIPRPETEELAQWVIAEQAAHNGRLIDGGTGSGCLAVTLALALKEAQVEAWDISLEALAVAKGNATQWQAPVVFRHQDLLASAGQLSSCDVVVSNPPYVRDLEAKEMAERVVAHEPHLALFVPDDDALRFYHALARLGAGTVYCEINEYLPEETRALFVEQGYATTLRTDAYGKIRMLKAWRNG